MEMMEKAAMASKGVHQAQFNHIQSISIWFISPEFLIIIMRYPNGKVRKISLYMSNELPLSAHVSTASAKKTNHKGNLRLFIILKGFGPQKKRSVFQPRYHCVTV